MAKESLTIRLSSALDTILGRETEIPKMLGDIEREVKTEVHHQTSGNYYYGWESRYNSRINYQETKDNLTGSSVVMAAVNWLATTLPEAPFQVLKDNADKKASPDTKHKLTRLMRRPNKHTSGSQLRKAFALSWLVDGNVYWQKVRSQRNEVVELWYIPHFMIEPHWPQSDSTVFIDHYLYKVNGKEYEIPVEDILHFKNGTDPTNTRKGLSPLASCLREVFTGGEVANFSATLLRNMGVVSHLLSPKEGHSFDNDIQAQAVKAQFEQNTTGENRARALVNTIPIDVERLGFSPQEMDLSKLRHLSEVAVSSCTGIPSAVLQYMIGQENGTSYASYKEAGRQGVESVVIPTLSYIAEEMDTQLLPDFEQNTDGIWCDFDLSTVRALQEDRDGLVKRTCLAYDSGIIMRSTAKEWIGVPVDPSGADDIYESKLPPLKPKDPNAPTQDEIDRALEELEEASKGLML